MASNFKVFLDRNEENAHLKISGKFDGSSACELTNILDRYFDDTSKIFIDTSDLSTIHSFGIDIFKTKYSQYKNIVFTGDPFRELTSRESRHVV